MKKSNAEIIKTIKEHRVVTEKELADILNYRKGSMNRRIKTLTLFGILDYVIIPSESTLAKYEFLKGYINVRLYFIDKDDMRKWFREKIPRTWNLLEMKKIMVIFKKDVKIEM